MKKRILSILLTLCMVLTLLPGITQPAMAAGEGTGNPAAGAFTLNTSGVNIITNADQLAYVAQQVNANAAGWASASYKLGSNIDLSAYTSWAPIGRYEYGDREENNKLYYFTGTFDGAGFAIKNLKVNTGAYYLGLFGAVGPEGTVKNLALIDSNIRNGIDTGTIVGRNDGTIQNCYSNGTIYKDGDWAQQEGGIVGIQYSTGKIENCYFSGNLGGGYSLGGIVGYNAVNINNCYTTYRYGGGGSVIGWAQMQGFAGATNDSWSDTTISGVNKGKLSLVDALNQWVSAQTPGSFTPWYCSSADGNACPGFVKEEFIVNISDGTGVGTTSTTASASLAGAITSGTTCVVPGETVTITVGTPDSAYRDGTVRPQKTGSYSTPVTTTLISAGTYKFTMPRYPVTIVVSYAAKSTGNNISTFNFTSLAVSGTVNNSNKTVTVVVPYGTNVSSLSPSITVSTAATINPISGAAQDFTSDVIYTVTAENGTTSNWTVIVSVKGATPTGVGFDAVTSMLTGISDGMEYSVNSGSTWVKITGSVSGKVAITGVTAAKGIRVRNNDAAPHTVPSDASIIDIAQAATPFAPTISAVTANSVTLISVAGNEYSKNGSTWQTSNLFDNLSPATGYTFYQRVAASGATLASIKSDGKAQYTAAAKPSLGVGYSINYATEKITVTDGYDVNTDAGFGAGTAVLSNTTLTVGTTYYVRVAANGGIPESEAASFTIPARSAAPASILAENITKTGTAITIANTVAGQEYFVNGTWYTPVNGKVEATGLDEGTDYPIVTRVKATENSFASLSSNAFTVKTKTAPASAPAAPTIGTDANKPTSNSITISTAAGNEYYISTSATAPTTWPASGNDYFKATGTDVHTFTGLTAATKHYIHVRIAETADAMPSASAYVAQYTQPTKPAASVVTVDYAAETISFDTTYEVSASADFAATTIPSGSVIQPDTTYHVRVKAIVGGAPASEAVSFTIPARPATPTAITAADITKTGTAITIVNTVAGQEYQVNGTWYTPQNGKVEVTGLAAGTDYPIVTRVKAKANIFSSLSSDAFTVKTKTAPASAPAEPTIGTDEDNLASDSITINTSAGNEYYISTSATAPTTWPVSGNNYFKATGTDVHTFTGLTAGTKHYIHVRVAETDDAMPSASAYVAQYTLPVTPAASVVTVNYAAETISFVNTFEVSASTDFKTTILSGSTITPGATYYVRKAADTMTTPHTPASAYTCFTIAVRPTEPSSSAYSYDYKNEKLIFGSEYEVSTATSGGSAITSGSTAITPGGTLYIRLKATSSAPVSDWTTITIPSRPLTTGLSVTAVRTNTSISVTTITGAEYSKDGGTTWQNSNEFTGLNANTSYGINIRYAATDLNFASTPLGSVTLKTKTSPGGAPSAPTVSSQTYNSITIDTIAGYQYAITTNSTSPTTWVAAETANGAKTFSGLSSATQYYVWVRVAETDTAMPSGHISKTAYTAAGAPDVNSVAINYCAETITFASATYEVNTNSDFTGSAVLSGSSIAAYIAGSGTEAQSLFVRVKAVTSGAPASVGTALSIPARPATPAAVGLNETIFNKNDGKITGVTTAMEWKLSGGTYAAVTADQALNGITGLSDATYYVRCAAVTSGSVVFSSAEQEISIAAGYTITVSFDSQGGSAVSQIAAKSYGDKITETVTAPNFSGYNFAGWYKDPACSEIWSFAIETLTDNVTLYAKWSAVPTYTVTGAIVDDASPAAVVAGANVKIMQGTNQFGTTGLTDTYGDFSINNVPAGNYNLVISKETKTAIIMISVSGGNVAVGNVILPSGNANSILVINGSDTPDVVVGGLNTEANAQLGTNTSVVITMTVEKKDASTAANGTEVSASVEGAGQLVGMIIDINLIRSVNGGSSTSLAETSNLIETIIPIPSELQDKATYKVYRYHGNAIDTITEKENTDKEKIVIDRANWTLTLYAKKFSTYAMGYTNPSSSTSYNITASAGEGGSISPSSANVSAFLNQTFTITPNAGYSISDVLVDSISVGAVSSYTFSNVRSAHTIKAVFIPTETAGLPYYVKDGKRVFIGFASDASGAMKYIAPSGVAVLFKENPKYFTDTSDHWAEQYIDFVTERELFVGTGGTEFSPQSGMTRAMFATVIGRLYERSYGMLQSKSSHYFNDVDYDDYYGVYVDWAAENNIITGVGGGLFETDREISRQEMATILYRFAKFLNALPDNTSNIELGYPDSADIAGWAKEAAALCQQTGIITGRDGGNFVPKGTATRAEVAAILQRFIVATVK